MEVFVIEAEYGSVDNMTNTFIKRMKLHVKEAVTQVCINIQLHTSWIHLILKFNIFILKASFQFFTKIAEII